MANLIVGIWSTSSIFEYAIKGVMRQKWTGRQKERLNNKWSKAAWVEDHKEQWNENKGRRALEGKMGGKWKMVGVFVTKYVASLTSSREKRGKGRLNRTLTRCGRMNVISGSSCLCNGFFDSASCFLVNSGNWTLGFCWLSRSLRVTVARSWKGLEDPGICGLNFSIQSLWIDFYFR